jgi:hypothetical protein
MRYSGVSSTRYSGVYELTCKVVWWHTLLLLSYVYFVYTFLLPSSLHPSVLAGDLSFLVILPVEPAEVGTGTFQYSIKSKFLLRQITLVTKGDQVAILTRLNLWWLTTLTKWCQWEWSALGCKTKRPRRYEINPAAHLHAATNSSGFYFYRMWNGQGSAKKYM